MRKLNHVAITPDGNRRFANKNKLSFQHAYSAGFEKIKQVLEWNQEADKVTLWALSLENFNKRSSFELKILFKLMNGYALDNLRNKTFLDEGVKVKFFGRRDLLPDSLNESFSKLEDQTQNEKSQLNVAIAYSGRDELTNAAKALARDVQYGKVKADEVNESVFSNYLYLNDNPDLVIRTGDAQRLSGLMPWQTAYSEIYFSKKLWPEFEKEDFDDAVRFYKATESRKGK